MFFKGKAVIKNIDQVIQEVEAVFLKKDRMNIFNIGDTIKVHYKILRGTKEQIQIFQGTVISIRGKGLSKMFNVRKISWNVGVERIFPLHSDRIHKIELIQKGRVRRAKLYYLKNRFGKSAQVKPLSKKS